MQIHKEGKKIVFGFWVLTLLLAGTLWRLGFSTWYLWIVPLILLAIFVSRFFRVPERKLSNHTSDKILAPADGKVVGVEQVDYQGTPYIMVSIFMSIWDVHINWIPIEGTIKEKKYFPGKFLMAIQPKASELNERSRTIISTETGDVIVTQVAGAVARRISTYPAENEKVNNGQELGFIKFGSRVDIMFPSSYTPTIKNGDIVRGVETIIGELKLS